MTTNGARERQSRVASPARCWLCGGNLKREPDIRCEGRVYHRVICLTCRTSFVAEDERELLRLATGSKRTRL